MKTIPPPCPEPEVGPKYWRSLDQLADKPEFRQFVEREFPTGASEFKDDVSRRYFVKIMSASFLLAGFGLTGCRKPEEHITPFSKMPEGYVHGLSQYYATSRPTRSGAIPLLVKSYDGRPTKVEGNTHHPAHITGTDRYTQASILNLYDPDRATYFKKDGNVHPREYALEILGVMAAQFSASGGEGLAFLLERSSSPTRARVQKLISDKYPKAKWYIHEPVDFDITREAASLVTGQSVKPEYHLDKAKRILSLDCDFIGAEEESYRHIAGFTKNRKLNKPEDGMNRLYIIEGMFSLTGANADHRLKLAPSQVAAAAAAILKEVGGNAGGEVDALAAQFKGDSKWIVECAKDLVESKGEALVLAGYRQPLAVHLLAQALNEALGAVGKTVDFLAVPESTEKSLVELAKSLQDGQVETLVILGANPVYNAPADLDWKSAQKKAKTVVRHGYYEDETAVASTWQIPATHYLETWGDARSADGTYVSVQPLIEPLFAGLSEIEVLARLGGLETTRGYDLVRGTFKQSDLASNFEEGWKKLLHDGYWKGSAPKPASVSINASALGEQLKNLTVSAPTKDSLEVVFHRDYKVDDGRYNNNGWLQELPDPVTKITWENTILISPKTAEALGLKIRNEEEMNLQVPIITVKVGNRSVTGPAWIQPGQADNVVALALGYGRQNTGRVGKDSGYNAYAVRTSDALYTAFNAKISADGTRQRLSTTQDHGAMEGRPIIREANLDQYQKTPAFAKAMNMEEPPDYPGLRDDQNRPKSMYPNPLDERKKSALHQWGMVIDLNSCVGCNACAVACQSENNVPIVGKEQVWRNREMHWLRIDRYFTGSADDPQMITQPMFCQHCEAAPCENVCPVNATSHDEEGLNVMTYNRCVGTRYCSNNCPYKVRRFNFFDYNKRTPDQLHGPFYPNPLTGKVDGEWGVKKWLDDPGQGYRSGEEWDLYKLAKNPDVTVRMRGVMEKCTFCVQRIEQAKIAQKVKAGESGDIRLKESEGTTPKSACQQACPAGAITFGDISDPDSKVSKLKANERNYSVLDFLLTKPRVSYLAKVRNPNPAMPDYIAHPLPGSLQEFSDKNGSPFQEHGEHHEKGAEPAHGAEGHKKGAE